MARMICGLRRDKNANRHIPAPIAAITSKRNRRKRISKDSAKLTRVKSMMISTRPRFQKKLRRPAAAVPEDAWRYSHADIPERKTNDGAQRCVIQRVKNNSGVV